MAANALVQTRIDTDIKDRATAILERQGMTVSDAVRILLTRTANEGALPLLPVNSAAYDAWFRAKVQEALDDQRPPISNEAAKARFVSQKARLRSKAR